MGPLVSTLSRWDLRNHCLFVTSFITEIWPWSQQMATCHCHGHQEVLGGCRGPRVSQSREVSGYCKVGRLIRDLHIYPIGKLWDHVTPTLCDRNPLLNTSKTSNKNQTNSGHLKLSTAMALPYRNIKTPLSTFNAISRYCYIFLFSLHVLANAFTLTTI